MEQVNSPWGLLPRGWRLSTIDEEKERLTDYVANGSFASLASNVHYKDTEYYAVLIRLVDFNNDFKGPFVYIDEHAYSFLSKSSLSGGEIIISNVGANVGTVFKCPNLPYKMSLAPNAITIKLKGDNDFYYYWFKSKIGQANIQALVTGSAQPKFNKTNFRSMYIPVPPLDVQRRIASILSSLDRKIELNNKINADLEEMAQAIFKNWFVDFEPFKDGKFVDSELGMIPEGWKVVTLDDLTSKFGTGLNPRKNFVLGHGNNYYVTIKNMGNNRIYLNDRCDKVDDEALAKINKRSKLQKGDLLFSGIGTIGRVAMVVDDPINWNTSESVFNMHPIDTVSSEFIYLLLLSDKFQQYVQQNAQGGVQQGIRMASLKAFQFAIPNDLKLFDNLVKPIISKVKSNDKENDTLSLLRDTLLPRLMSGELEVPE